MYKRIWEWVPAMLVVCLAIVTMMVPGTALAAGDILGDAVDKVNKVWESLRQVIYILGGIGLVVMAIFAFFGRFKWGHFLALCGGLFLVAGADALISFLGGSSNLGN